MRPAAAAAGGVLVAVASILVCTSCGGSSTGASRLDDPSPTTGPRSCEVVTQGRYQLRVWNDLTESVDVDFIDVVIPGVSGSRPVPFSALMDPAVCEIFGLPSEGTYSADVSRRSGGGDVRLRVTFDAAATGFSIGGRRAYTLRLARAGCSAATDADIRYMGEAVYTLCLP
jgi:hypothetical protein